MAPEECSPDALVDELREDHWKLAILFQRLSEGVSDGLDQGVLRRILDALATLFRGHAKREEGYLARTNHPGLARHKAEHDLVLEVIRSVVAAARLGRPLGRADIDAISALFTDILFVADSRDIAALGGADRRAAREVADALTER